MAANIFHVEFGLNETELTQALESRRYDLAERLIRETTSASYLDEGCYQRTPLYIVLCGHNEQLGSLPRNFFLAKLIIERGSDVNLRIPETYAGAEFMNPGKSPLELVSDFYNELTAHMEDCSLRVRWEPTQQVVIGFDKQRITTFSDLLQQVLDLTLTMLECGGHVGVRDSSGATLLHRTVVGSTEDDLLTLLCESGADYNATDRSGVTPLTAACSQLGHDWWHKCDHSRCHRRHVHYLLTLKDIKVDVQDRRGRTALFYCLQWLDTDCAQMLLNRLCNPFLRANIHMDTGQYRSCSPLFAGLAMMNDEKRPSLSLLVDSGYFDKPAISTELWEILEDDTSWQHLKVVGPQLIRDMFGVTSTSLKQLCSRVILRQLSSQPRDNSSALSTQSKQRTSGQCQDVAVVTWHSDEQHQDGTTEVSLHSNLHPSGQCQDNSELTFQSDLQHQEPSADVSLHSDRRPSGQRQDDAVDVSLHSNQLKVEYLTSCRLKDLVRSLHLPHSSLQCFETELLAVQLRRTIWTYDWHGVLSSDDSSVDSDESDTEYW